MPHANTKMLELQLKPNSSIRNRAEAGKDLSGAKGAQRRYLLRKGVEGL